jgi:hypothetical protein
VPSILAVQTDKNSDSNIIIWKKDSAQHRTPNLSRITRTKQTVRGLFFMFMCVMSLAFLLQNIAVSSSNRLKDDNEGLPDAAYHKDGKVGGQFGRGYNPHPRH